MPAEMRESTTAPSASILICLYNAERYIGDTLDSALAQTYRDFELIVVDDGSTDGSRAVLQRYTDPRLRVLRQANQGAAAALKAGLEAARGLYIAPLDADDLWTPDHLTAHVKELEARPEIALTFSWFRVIDDRGRDMGITSNHYRGTIGFTGLLRDFVIGATSNAVIRKSAIYLAGGLDPNIPHLYDLDLCLRIAFSGHQNIAAIPRESMRYRRHSGQISKDFEVVKLEWTQVIEKLRRLAPQTVAEAEGVARSNMNRYFAGLAYEASQYGEALRLLRSGFQYAPSAWVADRRNWLVGAASLTGLLTPARLHRRLERMAGLRRNSVSR